MEQTDSEDMARVLASYKGTGSRKLRNQLVIHYLPVVRSAAVQLRAMAGSSLEQEGLTDQGVLTLMECLNRHDPDRDARFETYAFAWVRGSTIDYIHSQDWVPHRAGNLQEEVDQAFSILSHKEMGELDVKEVAGYLSLPMERVEDHIKYMSHATILSFESVLQDMMTVFAKGELEVRDMDGRPEENLYYRELMKILTAAVSELEEKKRLVITLHYYEELKHSEITGVMGAR